MTDQRYIVMRDSEVLGTVYANEATIRTVGPRWYPGANHAKPHATAPEELKSAADQADVERRAREVAEYKVPPARSWGE